MTCPRSKDLDLIFALQLERTVNRDNTVSFQNLQLQIEPVQLARHAGGLQRHGAPASGWTPQPYPRATSAGTL